MHVLKYKILVLVVGALFILEYLPSILRVLGYFLPSYVMTFLNPSVYVVLGLLLSSSDKIVERLWGDEDYWIREIAKLHDHD